MKEKRTKKESIKKETEQKGRNVTVFSREDCVGRRRPDLYINWESFVPWFNQTLRYFGSSIDELRELSSGIKARAQSIVNNYNSKQVLASAVIKMAQSDFLNGRKKGWKSKQGFKASFIWLIESDEHFDKVFGGYYDNPPDKAETDRRQQEEEARELERQRQREANRRIDEEERERRRRQREFDAAHAATPEEVERITAGFHLPPLRPEERSPHERIFGKK